MTEIDRAIEEFADEQARLAARRCESCGVSAAVEGRSINVGTRGVALEYGLIGEPPRPWALEALHGRG